MKKFLTKSEFASLFIVILFLLFFPIIFFFIDFFFYPKKTIEIGKNEIGVKVTFKGKMIDSVYTDFLIEGKYQLSIEDSIIRIPAGEVQYNYTNTIKILSKEDIGYEIPFGVKFVYDKEMLVQNIKMFGCGNHNENVKNYISGLFFIGTLAHDKIKIDSVYNSSCKYMMVDVEDNVKRLLREKGILVTDVIIKEPILPTKIKKSFDKMKKNKIELEKSRLLLKKKMIEYKKAKKQLEKIKAS